MVSGAVSFFYKDYTYTITVRAGCDVDGFIKNNN